MRGPIENHVGFYPSFSAFPVSERILSAFALIDSDSSVGIIKPFRAFMLLQNDSEKSEKLSDVQ